jgi:hypothetical membrane protein
MSLSANNGKKAGILISAGGAQFAVFMIVAEAVFPNYSVSANYISDLGVWGKPSAAIFNPSIILFGLLVLSGAYFVQKTFKRRGFSSVLALSGLGALLVGFFPENTIVVNGVPVIHAIGALISFISGGLAAIASYRVTNSPLRYFSAVLGAASLLALVLFASTGSSGYLGIGVGGMERMIVYPTLAWTICFGGYLMASQEKK